MKRLGETPVVDRFRSGDATIEVAAKAEDQTLVAAGFMTDLEGRTSRG